MNARLLLPIPLLAFLATIAGAFAPAPVYRQPRKQALSTFLQSMQGTWGRAPGAAGKASRGSRIRIDGTAWTNLSIASKRGGWGGAGGPGGAGGAGGRAGRGGRGGREGPTGRGVSAYDIRIDTTRIPVALDLRLESSSRVRMKGIVKVEGDHLTFLYTTSSDEADRPKDFTETETASGLPVRRMNLVRVPTETPP